MSNMGFNQAFGLSQSCGFGNGFSYDQITVKYIAGIKNDLYTSGYYADDLSWFEGRTPTSTTYPTNVIQDPPSDDGSNFSRRWTGYFKAPTSETYTFYTTSDNASMMWIGDVAKSGWSLGNATVNNSGLHASLEKSGTAVLMAGRYYPIQIFFGDGGGDHVLTFSYSTPSITKTTNLTGLIYYNPVIPNGKGF
jgi:hypothetical protein